MHDMSEKFKRIEITNEPCDETRLILETVDSRRKNANLEHHSRCAKIKPLTATEYVLISPFHICAPLRR